MPEERLGGVLAGGGRESICLAVCCFSFWPLEMTSVHRQQPPLVMLSAAVRQVVKSMLLATPCDLTRAS